MATHEIRRKLVKEKESRDGWRLVMPEAEAPRGVGRVGLVG